MVPQIDACLCLIWWSCVGMTILLLCSFVIVPITCHRAKKRCHLHCWNVSGQSEWIQPQGLKHRCLHLWQSIKCSEGRPNSVSNLSLSKLLSWWRACAVPLLYWSFKTKAHLGMTIWHFYFLDDTTLTSFQFLVLKACRLYNVFGPGENQGIHAQFMTQASAMNNRKRIGLMRGAGTRFATWFYGLHHLLCQKKALVATIHSPYFATMAHNAKVALAVQDIESNQFWKAVYFLLRAVSPALRVLRYCDANKPAMNKIYYLCNRGQDALLRSNSF